MLIGPNLVRSTLIRSIKKSKKGFTFTGRGWGHGVGLCQWGMKKMADKEKISALLDDEELDQSIINALAVDKESEQAWQNFNLIGDVMRGDAPQGKEWNIAANVALALENEPAHTGFADVRAEPEVVAPVVDIRTAQQPPESQPTPRQAKRSLPAWFTQFGQVAIAASVSLAVIVGVQQYNGGDDGLVA